MLIIVVLTCSAVAVSAETTPTNPVDVTSPAVTTPEPTEPVVTTPDPSQGADPTAPTEGTGADVTDPSGTEATGTEPATGFTRPTEYDEDDVPSTYSDYISPAPIYTPADQDFDKQDWEKIELDLDVEPNKGGVSDFSNIKNNNTKGDKNSPLLLILCIVFWCLALSALTFMILYKPADAKKARHAVANTSDGDHKPPRRSKESHHLDDYNDGF